MTLRILWHEIRGNLWWRPLAWSVVISLLALSMLEIDRQLSYQDVLTISPWLFVDSADGARTLLGAIATAMLTVATLAFSILMVAVVQTANAYSPRILREYLADAGNQHVLGILVGVFLYTLIVLRRVEDAGQRFFLPMLSVSMAVVLSLLAVLAFIYFINHVAHSIEVSSIVNRIQDETAEMIESLFPAGLGQPWRGDGTPPLPVTEGTPLLTSHSGYLEAVDGDGLIEQLAEAGVTLRMEPALGDYLLPGSTLATLWPAEHINDDLRQELQTYFEINDERATVQDLLFGFQQLSDIALRALSPAVNDPRTAEAAIHVMGQLLSHLLHRPPITPYRCSSDGRLRLIANGPGFNQAIEVGYMALVPYLAGDAAALVNLLQMISGLTAIVTRPAEEDKLWQVLWRLAFAAEQAIASPWDRQAVNQQLRTAARNLKRPADSLLLKTELPAGYP